tara:strand:+ start:99 stop:1154 length:1056 start_codon:yes stop_codon:yes gene_type:complete
MGTIYKRKTNKGLVKYYCSIYHKNKRTRKYLGDDKNTAYKKFKKIEYEIIFAQHLNNENQRIEFTKALISFVRYLNTTNTSQRQIKTIYSKINNFKAYCEIHRIIKLLDINKELCNKFIFDRSKSKIRNKYNFGNEKKFTLIKKTTLIKEIGVLKRFFNYCIEMEWLNSNPFKAIKVKNKLNFKPRFYFSDKQIRLILSKAGKYTDFCYFLVQTGLRPTDAFLLSSKHIFGRYLSIRMNKTGDYLNQIPLTNKVMQIIEPRLKNKGIIFPEIETLYQRKKCLRKIQSLFDPNYVRENNINLHTFRHTYARNMLNKGVPKEVLQTFLGHRSIKTTEIYANMMDKKELVKWID